MRTDLQKYFFYYIEADIVIVVLNAIEKYNLEKYNEIIENFCKENVPRIIVVNKIDMFSPPLRKKDHHYVSCKTNEGVGLIWNDITKIALQIPR
jgi:tRNA U34 5-carboxymethylaminomethyl modifying GTPase MnmE/TrmE